MATELGRSFTMLPGRRVRVSFIDGVTKEYDLHEYVRDFPQMAPMLDPDYPDEPVMGVISSGITWNDEIDIGLDTIRDDGEVVPTPFDGLITVPEACDLWGLTEFEVDRMVHLGELEQDLDYRDFRHGSVCRMRLLNYDSLCRRLGTPRG